MSLNKGMDNTTDVTIINTKMLPGRMSTSLDELQSLHTLSFWLLKEQSM